MTHQFHEGEEVEVLKSATLSPHSNWCKAEIVCVIIRGPLMVPTVAYIVQFPDGTRVVFDAKYIRPVDSPPIAAAKKVAHDFGEALMGRGKYGGES